MWTTDAGELVRHQLALAAEDPVPWHPEPGARLLVAGCFVCFPRGHEGAGAAGDPAYAGAAALRGRRREGVHTVVGAAGAPYQAELLALREGPTLAAAVTGLPTSPDVLLVNATGRDHSRRAGLALHLGAELDIPSIGVTHRPLRAAGAWPDDEPYAASLLLLDGQAVGAWVRTRPGRRPVAVHAGWRTGPDVAVEVVRRCGGRHRTPAPLREARRAARSARARRGRAV